MPRDGSQGWLLPVLGYKKYPICRRVYLYIYIIAYCEISCNDHFSVAYFFEYFLQEKEKMGINSRSLGVAQHLKKRKFGKQS